MLAQILLLTAPVGTGVGSTRNRSVTSLTGLLLLTPGGVKRSSQPAVWADASDRRLPIPGDPVCLKKASDPSTLQVSSDRLLSATGAAPSADDGGVSTAVAVGLTARTTATRTRPLAMTTTPCSPTAAARRTGARSDSASADLEDQGGIERRSHPWSVRLPAECGQGTRKRRPRRGLIPRPGLLGWRDSPTVSSRSPRQDGRVRRFAEDRDGRTRSTDGIA